MSDFEFNRANECLNEQEKIVDRAITSVNLMIFVPEGKPCEKTVMCAD
jgi:hypothetical protein